MEINRLESYLMNHKTITKAKLQKIKRNTASISSVISLTESNLDVHLQKKLGFFNHIKVEIDTKSNRVQSEKASQFSQMLDPKTIILESENPHKNMIFRVTHKNPDSKKEVNF